MPDESVIHDLLDRLTEAWNAGDAEGYANLFTEDADYVTFFGQNLPGRQTIEEAHRALFAGPLAGSRLTGMNGRTARGSVSSARMSPWSWPRAVRR